jgi:hypothetical protein
VRPARRPIAIAGALVFACLLAAVAAWGAFAISSGPSGPRRAAIVDQLELTVPNPVFLREIKQLLEANGYEVDYIPGDEVTVDFYRHLPERDYDLIILRTHSTADITRGETNVNSVSLFTGEPYSEDRYYEEQLRGAIGFAQYTESSPKLFGITAEFIRSSMKGKFNGTTILMMGCQGLINGEAADAFADRGARTFVGWDGLVSAQHTDEATRVLLQHLVVDQLSVADATSLTMASLGPDPHFGSRLVARP